MYCACPEFQRCCACLPLRRGILFLAYVYMLVCVLIILFYSITNMHIYFIIRYMWLPIDVMIFLYSVELVFTILLIYGLHKKQAIYVKIFYFFMISILIIFFAIQIMDLTRMPDYYVVYSIMIYFSELCTQLYLLFMVRSLLKKLEITDSQSFGNQLHQIVNGQVKTDTDEINPNTVVAVETDYDNYEEEP